MACPFYRERWVGEGEQHEGRSVLYHVICLQNTPPTTIDEQQECLEARTTCWRLRTSRRRRPEREADLDDDVEPAASAVS